MVTPTVVHITTTVLAIYSSLMPTVPPSITEDPWDCATENITKFFDLPKPTGNLLDALLSYGDKLNENCTITVPATGTILPTCPFPPQSELCAFATSAASELLPAYSSYGSAASSWWSAHSSGALSMAKYCPNRWYGMMRDTLDADVWLNDTIAFGNCYAEAHATSEAPTITATESVTKATTSGGTALEPKEKPNNVVGRMDGVEMLAVAGMGLAAAAVNSAL
jgi:hypothetical protein